MGDPLREPAAAQEAGQLQVLHAGREAGLDLRRIDDHRARREPNRLAAGDPRHGAGGHVDAAAVARGVDPPGANRLHDEPVLTLRLRDAQRKRGRDLAPPRDRHALALLLKHDRLRDRLPGQGLHVVPPQEHREVGAREPFAEHSHLAVARVIGRHGGHGRKGRSKILIGHGRPAARGPRCSSSVARAAAAGPCSARRASRASRPTRSRSRSSGSCVLPGRMLRTPARHTQAGRTRADRGPVRRRASRARAPTQESRRAGRPRVSPAATEARRSPPEPAGRRDPIPDRRRGPDRRQ